MPNNKKLGGLGLRRGLELAGSRGTGIGLGGSIGLGIGLCVILFKKHPPPKKKEWKNQLLKKN